MPRTGFATIGADPTPYLFELPVCCATSRCWKRPPPAAAADDAPGARRHRAPRAAGDEGRRRNRAGADARHAARRHRLRRDPDPHRSQVGIRASRCRACELPTDGNGQLWVNFAPARPSRYVSAKDVLDGNVPADRFQQRLVLIGTSAVGLLDIKATPVDAAMPGVEVACAGSGERADADAAVAAELRRRRRTRHHGGVRHHLRRAGAAGRRA